MIYRLGVIGHTDTFEHVTKVAREYFEEVETSHVEFSTDDKIDDTVVRVLHAMKSCDGLLYSRYDPYLLVSSRLSHTVPARYVTLDSSHLITSLLRGIVIYGIPLTDISIDGFSPAAALKTLVSVGAAEGSVALRVVTADLNMPGFVQETLAQHIDNRQRGSALCVTGITSVYSALVKMGIPAVAVNPNDESFVHEIRNLMLRSRLEQSVSDRHAAVFIESEYKDRYRFYREIPLREIDECASLGKMIHVFAEKIDGAVFSWAQGSFGIVCETAALCAVTRDYTDIDLMDGITNNTAFDVRIGIGQGKSAAEAAANGRAALTRAARHKGSSAFVITGAQSVLGPIVPRSQILAPDSTVDNRLITISTQAGIRFDTIHKLYQHTRMRASMLYTSSDIAEILGTTPRTANHIATRLIDSGHAAIVGKSLTSPKGRPHRVIKLLI